MPSKSRKQAKFIRAAYFNDEVRRRAGFTREQIGEWYGHDKRKWWKGHRGKARRP